MSTPYRSVFGYYGGKSKIAHLYPVPRHKQIIEPFAGGAAYSLRHWRHDVWLNDVSPVVVGMWRFLQSRDAARDVAEFVPCAVRAGQTLDEIVRSDCPDGLREIMRGSITHGSQGKHRANVVSSRGAARWTLLRRRLMHWIPRVAHWRITQGCWSAMDFGGTATWFVDPPYDCPAGRRYAYRGVDFATLATWCRSRPGHVIVCEAEGADWLPFSVLRSGCAGMAAKSRARDVWWTTHSDALLPEALLV